MRTTSKFLFLGILINLFLFNTEILPASGIKNITPQNKSNTLLTTIEFEFNKTVLQSDSRQLAVAFHSIYFINSAGAQIGQELVFGSSSFDQSLIDGWYLPESASSVGTYRWGGTNSKKASVTIAIPADAEGMMLEIRSIEDSLSMNVKIGGTNAATLLVDKYWHDSYVPVGAVIPEPKPVKEPVWTDGYYFPKFPTSDSLYIIHVHTTWGNSNWENIADNPSWRVHNYNDMTALTLVSMQGIINRYGARVYFEWDDPFRISESWKSTIDQQIKSHYLYIDGLSAINFLYRRFSSYFSGIVIYDPEVPETINLATMYSGLDNLIMAAPSEINLPGMPQFSNVNDLRNLVNLYSWKATVDDQTKIYQWVLDNLWNRLDHRMLGIISAGPPASREIDTGTGKYVPLETIARDYFIALKLPCIYLHPLQEPQRSLFKEFLNRAPSPIPISGCAPYENDMLETISPYGDFENSFTWPGAIFSSGNMSALASINVLTAKYVPSINPSKILKFSSGAPAATMFTTDGDAMMYILQNGYNIFDWRNVQGQNFGWTISSMMSNIAPIIWNYYVNTAIQTSLMPDINGAGYIDGWLFNDFQIKNYLKNCANYLQLTGMDVIHIWEGMNDSFWTTGTHPSLYYEYLNNSGYKGSILGYNSNYYRGLGVMYGGSPAPTVRTAYRINSKNFEWCADEISSRKPGEEFYNAVDIPKSGQGFLSPGCQIVDDADAYGGKAAYIPKSFGQGMIFMFGPMALAPGRYEVTLRAKVTENTSPNGIVSFKLMNWANQNTIYYKNVAASSFTSQGKYQEFILSFTLDQLTTNVGYWADYTDGTTATTDLYIDYLKSKNLDGTYFPVTGTMVIDNININENGYMNRIPEQFTSRFESKGGVVLNPSEYVAALNPEYMIPFAKTYLGNSTEIQAAQDLFNQKKYFESLVKVREALTKYNGLNPPKLVFKVNMISRLADLKIKNNVVGVRGNYSPFSWNDTYRLYDDNNDGIYEAEVTFDPSSVNNKVQYKFVIENLNTKNVNSEGSVGDGDFGNRTANISSGRNELPVVYFDNKIVGVQENKIPTEYSLSQNYPNPFNPTTKIKLCLPERATTKLIVYDVLGREVKVLLNSEMNAGYHEIEFNASNMSSGIYFYKILAGEFTSVKKMILIK